MDVKFINPFILATQTVFKTMLNIDLTVAKPVLKNHRMSSSEVTGIIGFAGDAKGTICLCFSREGALFLYKTLMGEECGDLGPEVVDTIGELTNITSGQARKELEKIGTNLKAALPTVVIGKDVELHFISALPIVSLPFHFSSNGTQETMHVDFSFE